jgi:hypothetical protein
MRGVRVTPFVAVADPPLKLVPNQNEISEVLSIPLAAVLKPNAVHEGEEILPDRTVRTWQFDFESLHVWGATGRILRDFATRFGDCPDKLSTYSLPSKFAAR